MVNAKIDYIHMCVHDGGHPVLDEHEQDELEGCVEMLDTIAELHQMEHELLAKKMMHNPTMAEPIKNPY